MIDRINSTVAELSEKLLTNDTDKIIMSVVDFYKVIYKALNVPYNDFEPRFRHLCKIFRENSLMEEEHIFIGHYKNKKHKELSLIVSSIVRINGNLTVNFKPGDRDKLPSICDNITHYIAQL